jgi:hypothetical protein
VKVYAETTHKPLHKENTMKTRTILTALTAATILTLIIAPNIIWALTLPILTTLRHHPVLTLTAVALTTVVAYLLIGRKKKQKNR